MVQAHLPTYQFILYASTIVLERANVFVSLVRFIDNSRAVRQFSCSSLSSKLRVCGSSRTDLIKPFTFCYFYGLCEPLNSKSFFSSHTYILDVLSFPLVALVQFFSARFIYSNKMTSMINSWVPHGPSPRVLGRKNKRAGVIICKDLKPVTLISQARISLGKLNGTVDKLKIWLNQL